MASQFQAWWSRVGSGMQRAQRAVTPWPAAMEVQLLPGAPPPRLVFFRRALGSPRCAGTPAGNICLSSRRWRVRSPSRAPHQGRLIGRTRGPEPRDGGSSPSPGAKPNPTWPSGKAAVCRTVRTGFESSPHEICDFAGTPSPGSGPAAGVAQKVERHVEGVRGGGSKPSSSTIPE